MAKLKFKHNNSIYSVTDDSVRDAEISAILNNGGVKNLISYLYENAEIISGTITKSAAGLTFTITPYKITVSGVATEDLDFWAIALLAPRLPAGEYACTCTFSTSYDSTKFFFIETRHWNSVMDGYDHICTMNANEDLALLPCIRTGANFSTPVDFYPMIRDARISDRTYAPYAMTNRELTEKAIKQLSVSLTIPAGVLTGGVSLNLAPNRIVGIVLIKNDNVYYEPIIYSVYDTGILEAQVLDNTPPDVDRTYNFYINYI